MRKWIGVGIVSAATLIGGGLWAHAQVQVAPPPQVISGAEAGFRVDGWEGDTPVGRWVVRSGGKWIEPKLTGGLRRLTTN